MLRTGLGFLFASLSVGERVSVKWENLNFVASPIEADEREKEKVIYSYSPSVPKLSNSSGSGSSLCFEIVCDVGKRAGEQGRHRRQLAPACKLRPV